MKNYRISLVLFFCILFSACFEMGYSQGDNPCTATLMTVNAGDCATYTTGTTVGATYSNNAANGGTPSCAGPGNPDVWYKFVAPLNGLITINTSAGTMTDSGMELYGSTTNLCTGTLVAGNCDNNGGAGNMSQLNLCGLTGGDTYFLRIWSRSGVVTGTFGICFYNPVVPSSSTNCSPGAATICSSTSFSGNSSGAGVQELNTCNQGCLSTEHQSSWYYFTTPTGGNLDMTISPSNGSDDYDFAIWGPYTVATIPCPPNGAPLRCSWAAGGGNTGVSSTNNAPQTDLTEGAGGNKWVQTIASSPGNTYILLVDNFATSSQPFTINWSLSGGATLGCTVLPIELLNFNARPNGNKVDLSWSTASEANNDFFTIERSSDGVNFDFVANVHGAGNSSSVLNYSATDNSPLGGISYYRLSQTDFNGKLTYASLAEVEFIGNSNFSFNVYPNPNDGTLFNITLSADKGEEILVTVYDDTGRQTYSKTLVTQDRGDNVYALDPSGKLAAGIYLVTATSREHIYNKKLIVK